MKRYTYCVTVLVSKYPPMTSPVETFNVNVKHVNGLINLFNIVLLLFKCQEGLGGGGGYLSFQIVKPNDDVWLPILPKCFSFSR